MIPVASRSRDIVATKQNGAVLITPEPTGTAAQNCCVCCRAPACCACCSIMPCCENPEYISTKLQASRYIYIRENSLEWNEPQIVFRPGNCCGFDICQYDVQDAVTVLFYDDAAFEHIYDGSGCLNDVLIYCCGGNSESVTFAAKLCYGCCYRSKFCGPAWPICCPQAFIPCATVYTVYPNDSLHFLHELKKARAAALHKQ
jgi:hypothetical protein